MSIQRLFGHNSASMGRLSGGAEQKRACEIGAKIAEDSLKRDQEYWANKIAKSRREQESIDVLLDAVRRLSKARSCPSYLIRAANAVINEMNGGDE